MRLDISAKDDIIICCLSRFDAIMTASVASPKNDRESGDNNEPEIKCPFEGKSFENECSIGCIRASQQTRKDGAIPEESSAWLAHH